MFTLSAVQVIFYIMTLCSLCPILIRYQENPEELKPNIAIEGQTKPLVFRSCYFVHLTDGINATIWIAQRSAMGTKPGYDSTLITPALIVKIRYFSRWRRAELK